jgi:peptidyl-prolyl cis-trans isomerase D
VAPARARIAHILVPDETKAKAALSAIENGKQFEDLAKGVSEDESTAEKGGALEGWVRKGADYIPGVGNLADAVAAIWETEEDGVIDEPFKSEKGLHIFKVLKRELERQKPFEEVKQEVYRDLRTSKEREVQQQLLEQLKDRYDVVIRFAKFADAAGKDTGSPDVK